jgi:hypothetical protein
MTTPTIAATAATAMMTSSGISAPSVSLEPSDGRVFVPA